MNTTTPDTLDALLKREGSVTFSAEQVATIREAVRLADDYTRSEVECLGIDCQFEADMSHWWHTPQLHNPGDLDHNTIKEATDYLKRRQRINTHPKNACLFNFHGHDPVPD